MQPRNPYQGAPTSNMSFPTEAYMAAAANAAKIQADAQARMGEQIGAGLQKAGAAVGAAIERDKEQKADYDASLKLYESPSFKKAMGLSDKDALAEMDALKTLKDNGGYKAANEYSQKQITPLFKYAMMGKELEMQKQLVTARAGAEAGLIGQRQANEVLNQATDFANKQKAYTFQTDEQIRLEKEKAKLKSGSGVMFNPSVIEKPN